MIEIRLEIQIKTYRNTFNTRIVAGELTIFRSSSFMVDCSNVSSRGLLEAEVAIANAAAAVDVLLLKFAIQSPMQIQKGTLNKTKKWLAIRNMDVYKVFCGHI